jgi:hypothetical protein
MHRRFIDADLLRDAGPRTRLARSSRQCPRGPRADPPPAQEDIASRALASPPIAVGELGERWSRTVRGHAVFRGARSGPRADRWWPTADRHARWGNAARKRLAAHSAAVRLR